MAKYYGAIGYAETEETAPGVWSETVTERNYYGNIIKDRRQVQNGEGTNDNLVVSNQISIVADPYALQNFFAIRYAKWMGVAWKVTSVEVQAPRLVLSLGGVYNGDTA